MTKPGRRCSQGGSRESRSTLSRTLHVLGKQLGCSHQLRLATPQRVFDFIVSGGGLCRRHRQRTDGQEPQDAMVTERRAQCRSYQSSRSRWSIVRFTPRDGRLTPSFCPLPSTTSIRSDTSTPEQISSCIAQLLSPSGVSSARHKGQLRCPCRDEF